MNYYSLLGFRPQPIHPAPTLAGFLLVIKGSVMSHYWRLRCTQCGEETDTDINHGDNVYPAIAGDWHYLKQIAELSKSLKYATVNIDVYAGGDLVPFLIEHSDHGVEMVSEYAGEPSKPLEFPNPSG